MSCLAWWLALKLESKSTHLLCFITVGKEEESLSESCFLERRTETCYFSHEWTDPCWKWQGMIHVALPKQQPDAAPQLVPSSKELQFLCQSACSTAPVRSWCCPAPASFQRAFWTERILSKRSSEVLLKTKWQYVSMLWWKQWCHIKVNSLISPALGLSTSQNTFGYSHGMRVWKLNGKNCKNR